METLRDWWPVICTAALVVLAWGDLRAQQRQTREQVMKQNGRIAKTEDAQAKLIGRFDRLVGWLRGRHDYQENEG